jgi:hypothetical protein
MKGKATVTLSNENGPRPSRPSLEPRPAPSIGQRPTHAPRQPIWPASGPRPIAVARRRR